MLVYALRYKLQKLTETCISDLRTIYIFDIGRFYYVNKSYRFMLYHKYHVPSATNIDIQIRMMQVVKEANFRARNCPLCCVEKTRNFFLEAFVVREIEYDER